ncbi:GntR family transcriptional regulator [Blastococcus saxobsidens]|uniref:Transcriptional regulator, GntR family n=1 Tax=Blastococcus saxobsidens (strain DD2) TaxID=1146883 RepID=H6RNU0_BLASD|nr:GntR family transcriptional regulator [Blastococcus saxobsidens]CCG05238.1 Transcriptional regulator, GntR family [Blastococcus saxobsidens DD2]
MTTANVFSSKGDAAYAELRARILRGDLPPGSRLAQHELASTLGMSLTPLREAIRRLSSEGLIDLDTHRDARVAAMNATEARQLFEVRLSLDPTAAGLAAEHRTEADLAALRGAADRLLPVTRAWGEDALDAHRAFHRALYVASHNDVLVRMLDDLWDKGDRYRRLGLDLPPGDQPRTRDHREHHELVELITARDSTGAAELMRTHIERSLTAAAITALEHRRHEQADPGTGSTR